MKNRIVLSERKRIFRGGWLGWVLIMLWAVIPVACGDGKHDSPEKVERPEFEQAAVTVRIDETAVNRILGATQVELISVPDIAEFSLNGCELSITGKKKGDGTVTVRADGQRLRCSVHVVGDDSVEETESAEMIKANLKDGTLRISVGKRVIRFESSGAMFSMTKDGSGIRAVRLQTGETMGFKCKNINLMSRDAVTGTALSDAVLTINDNELGISGCHIAQCDESGMWVRGVTNAKEAVWVVVPAEF